MPVRNEQLGVAMGLALYICFLAGDRQRIAHQRACIAQFRQHLAQKFRLFGMLQPGSGWDNDVGFRVMVVIWLIVLVFASLSFFSEGNILGGGLLVFTASQYAVCLAKNLSKSTLVNVTRFHLCVQGFAFFLITTCSDVVVRRAILIRAMAVLIFIESLEEALLHLVLASSLLFAKGGGNVGLLLLPVQMFALVILPMHVLGISEWISSSTTLVYRDKAKRLTRTITMTCCLVPMFVVLGSYVRNPLPKAYFLWGMGMCIAGVLLKWTRLGILVDYKLCPKTLKLNKLAVSRGNVCRMLRVLALIQIVSWLLDYQYLILLLTSTGIMLIISEDRIYSKLQADLFLWAGALMVLNHQNVWASGLIGFLGLMCTISLLVTSCNREVIFRHMAQEKEAEIFLSHAIKQKFAAVGAAAEQILLTYHNELLFRAMFECRMGHDRCHAANLFRKLDQNEPRATSKLKFEDVQQQLESTTSAQLLLTSNTVLDKLDGVEVEMDWEMLHLVLTDLARTGQTLAKAWCVRKTSHLCLQLERNMPEQPGVILSKLVSELNGDITGNLVTFQVKFQVPNSPPLKQTSLQFQVELGGQHTVLSKLKFALVDDNLLIRKNVDRMLHRSLGVPLANLFTAGATMEECLCFPPNIIQYGADIAIFDQNIDFDSGETLKGSDLAFQAKQLGFKGCLILHSSDVNLLQILSQGVFHGLHN
ncbi:hypothetical protein BASA81_012820 [Batrachochytrium salamandrivorans]|nr:hypothetical protein BASA81_012820 [Batrachochytrium salamandrivorans]